MSNTPARPGAHGPVGTLARIRNLIGRLWALFLLLMVSWVTYLSLAYMAQYVFQPSKVPTDLLQWRPTLTAAALRSETVPGIDPRSPRAPLARYHLVDRWFEPDPTNNCTVSGCHSPLPHKRSKDTRAFANLHTTFLACRMCHDKNATGAMKGMWVSTATGTIQQPPAVLRLIRELAVESEEADKDAMGRHKRLLALVQEARNTVPDDGMLEHFQVLLDTSQPGSPVWRKAVTQLAAELPKYALGEYEAKIHPLKEPAKLQEQRAQTTELAQQYLTMTAGRPESKDIRHRIHAEIVPKPLACMACHGQETQQFNLQELGYTPAREAALRAQPVAHLMQQIREGRPFYLPGVLLDSPAPPASAPATQPR